MAGPLLLDWSRAVSRPAVGGAGAGAGGVTAGASDRDARDGSGATRRAEERTGHLATVELSYSLRLGPDGLCWTVLLASLRAAANL